MKEILYTRSLRLKKDWKSIIFWLCFPLLLTLLTMKLIGFWSNDTKIPIALVIEEESLLTNQLVEKIKEVPYLKVTTLKYREAINQLEQHRLDSVYVIKNQYEEMIKDGKRNNLIEAYSSNQSYAYFAVTELIKSFVQDDVSRSKAAYEVKNLYEKYNVDDEWNWESIVQASIEKQESQQLLDTSFAYQNDKIEVIQEEQNRYISIWGIWALFCIIATFFLFDWVLKEKRNELQVRWIFLSTSFTKYASINFLFYSLMLLIVDLVSALVLNYFNELSLTSSLLIALIFFRVVMNLLIFLFVNLFKQPLIYYVSAIGFTLVIIVLGGVIIPMEGSLKWMGVLSPVHSLLSEEIPYYWLFVLIVLFCVWYWKGDKVNA